jgi:hypothetical protein
MLPYFNTSGPCVPGEHYTLSPERRFHRVMRLIDDEATFKSAFSRAEGIQAPPLG